MEAHQTSRPSAGDEYSTWIAFAGVMMVILGSLDAFWGLAAILNNEVVVVGGTGALIFDITTWGWIHLLLGLLTAGAGAGLFFGKTWARTVAVIAAAASMIGSFAWLPHYPIWGILIIALDVFVMWAAIVHGRALVDE
jgi:hypothetical protein